MRKQTFFLFLFISFFSSCDFNIDLPPVVDENLPLENCQDDLNVPSINILWEKESDLTFSPIIYKDFVLAGKDNTLSFFNKETGDLEKTLDVTFSVSGSPTQNLNDVLEGNCFIEGDNLVFQRYFAVSGSYEYDTLYTELLNLETGVISRINKSEVAFDHAPIDINRRINLLGYNLWQNSTGDTLMSSYSKNEDKTLINTFNVSTDQMEFELNLDVTAGYRELLLVKDEIIYFRGLTQLVAIDVSSQSILWEKSDLKSNFIDGGTLYNRNLHITDKHVIDFSRGVLSVLDKNNGALLFEQKNMPNTIINTRTLIHNDELIVTDNSILRIDLNNGCAIWQENEPNDNQGFSGIIVEDETLNRLYTIKNGKLVCIQL